MFFSFSKSDMADGSGSDIEGRLEDLELEFSQSNDKTATEKQDDEQTVQHLYFSEDTTQDGDDLVGSSVVIPDDVSEATTTAPVCKHLPSGHIAQVSKQIDDGTESLFSRISKYDKKNKNFGENQFLGDGLNQIFVACRTGDAGIVRVLRQKYGDELDINKMTGECDYGDDDAEEANKVRHGLNGLRIGITPLFLATRNNHVQVVKELLEFPQIDVNRGDGAGMCAMHILCASANANVVRQLLTHEAIDINKPDERFFNTPLCWCSCARGNGKAECVRLLLAREEIDVNYQTKTGRSALMRFCQCGDIDTVRQLLEHKSIDLSLKNAYGKTALDIASEFNQTEIVRLLEEHMAKSNTEKK